MTDTLFTWIDIVGLWKTGVHSHTLRTVNLAGPRREADPERGSVMATKWCEANRKGNHEKCMSNNTDPKTWTSA